MSISCELDHTTRYDPHAHSRRSWGDVPPQWDDKVVWFNESIDPLRERIKDRYPRASYSTVAAMLAVPGGDIGPSPYATWVTDNPQSLFGRDSVFHVTGSHVLHSLAGGTPLLPANKHEGVIRTHRGLALGCMTILMDAAGVPGDNKNAMVFAANRVDQELAAMTQVNGDGKVDKLLLEELTEMVNGELVLQRDYRSLLDPDHSSGRDGVGEIDPHRIDRLMSLLFRYGGMREGFYTQLERCLKTGRTVGGEPLYDIWWRLQDHIDAYLDVWRHEDLRPSQAVVLEIDPGVVYDSVLANGPYPFMLGDRHPDRIKQFPYVPPEAISRVWAHSPGQLDRDDRRNFKIEDLGDLPPDRLLDPDIPARIDPPGDPYESICRRLYHNQVPPQEVFGAHLKGGMIGPIMDIYIPAPEGKQYLDYAFGVGQLRHGVVHSVFSRSWET